MSSQVRANRDISAELDDNVCAIDRFTITMIGLMIFLDAYISQYIVYLINEFTRTGRQTPYSFCINASIFKGRKRRLVASRCLKPNYDYGRASWMFAAINVMTPLA